MNYSSSVPRFEELICHVAMTNKDTNDMSKAYLFGDRNVLHMLNAIHLYSLQSNYFKLPI